MGALISAPVACIGGMCASCVGSCAVGALCKCCTCRCLASPFKTNRAQFPSPRRATTGTFAFGGADDEVSRELAPTLNQSPSRKGGLGSPAQAAAFGGSNMRALLMGGPGAAP